MKTKLGILLIVFGLVLMVMAGVMFFNNEQEQIQAADSVDSVMPQLVQAIVEKQEETQKPVHVTAPAEEPETTVVTLPEPEEMSVVEIDGHEYIGFLGIPTIQTEVPIMADWSYSKLKISPCRFTGDLYDDNLVIMSHNYTRHLGSLRDLRVGDPVTFTDVNGKTTAYEVVAMDILPATAVDEMVAGEYDLTLFTCTYGTESRITARCDRVDN